MPTSTLGMSGALAYYRRPARHHINLPLLALAILNLLWSQHMPLAAQAEQTLSATNISERGTAKQPIIYKRLRFENNFLQVQRRFTKDLSIQERKVTLQASKQVTLPNGYNDTEPVKYTYYENPKIDARSLTQDDIIFEALDQAYLTRLVVPYVFTYDQKRDMARASDPNLVSRARCDLELDYLLGHLNTIESARKNRDPSGVGVRLNNSLSISVLALFDAITGEEPGLLEGNYLWSGNWRICQKSLIFDRAGATRLSPSNSVIEFKSRYCIASIRSKRWDSIARSRVCDLEGQDHFRYPDQRYNYARFHRIQLGLCLPESCDSTLIERRPHDVHRLATHKLSEPLKSYRLTDLFCLPDETSPLREVHEPSGKLFLAFATLWLGIMLGASLYDYDRKKNIVQTAPAPVPLSGLCEKLIDSMSLARNWDRLTETRSCKPPACSLPASDKAADGADTVRLASERNKPSANDLLFLNCVKALTTPIIILGHSGMMSKHLDRFPINYDTMPTALTHFIYSTIFFVDWYFVITGFITTYVMFATRRVERNNLAAWVHSIVHRYLRLAPLYLLLFWFAKSLFVYTGRGPLWDYGTNNMTFRGICYRESYLYPLTLTSNLHPIHQECIMPSWYISNDFQFYLITPLLLVLLHKSPLAGWLTALGGIGACLALRFYRYLTDEHSRPLDLMRPRWDLYMRNNWDMHSTYVYPQYRVASYLVGVLASHYVYMVLSGQWRSPLFYDRSSSGGSGGAKHRQSSKTPKVNQQAEMIVERKGNLLRLSLWLVSVATLVALMFVTGLIHYFPPSMEPHVRQIQSFLYAGDHVVASLGMALFIVTMMFGQFAGLRRIMSAPFWTVASRVGFLVYLLQIEVIYWLAHSADTLREQNTLNVLEDFFILSGILYPLATVLTLLVELPIAQLERNFVAPLFCSKPSFTSSANDHNPARTALIPPTSPAPRRRNNALASVSEPRS